jgi:enoyl-CoA hydratase
MATLAVAPAAKDTRALALENVLYEKKGAIAYVTINRPQVLNALNGPTLANLRVAFEDARNDASVRGVILTGAGDKAFAAGADIGQLARASAVEAEQSSRSTQATFRLIEDLGKPVIAAINGFALGGGCEAALACTIRIATPHSRFGQPEVKLGVIPGGGGTQRLPRLVGKGRALQLMLTGGMIDAEEAYRMGLVNEIVPADMLIPRAEAILQEIAANAPLAVRYAMEAVNSEIQSDGILLEASYFGLLAGTEDKQEGTSAFLEKRAPHFSGR